MAWRAVVVAPWEGEVNRELVDRILRSDRDLGHEWRLKEELRDILRLEPVKGGRKASQRWIRSAACSSILPMVGLAYSGQRRLQPLDGARDVGDRHQ